jgi:predicted Zn-dependent protease
MGYLRPMTRIVVTALYALMLLAGCAPSDRSDPCKAFFTPYPDLYADVERNAENAAFLDAMSYYRNGDHARAVEGLSDYARRKGSNRIALLYLANSLLATGRPFDAELQLDHLDRTRLKGTRDENEWYTLLCWVCSGQLERALPEAQRIAGMKRHTYSKEAAELVTALEP